MLINGWSLANIQKMTPNEARIFLSEEATIDGETEAAIYSVLVNHAKRVLEHEICDPLAPLEEKLKAAEAFLNKHRGNAAVSPLADYHCPPARSE